MSLAELLFAELEARIQRLRVLIAALEERVAAIGAISGPIAEHREMLGELRTGLADCEARLFVLARPGAVLSGSEMAQPGQG